MNKILLVIGIVIFAFIILTFLMSFKYFKERYKNEMAEILTKDEYKVKGKFE